MNTLTLRLILKGKVQLKNFINFVRSIINMFSSNPACDKLIKRYDDGQYVFTYRFISDNCITYFRATYTTGLGWYYRDCCLVPKDYITFSELVNAYRHSEYLARGGSKDT